MKEVFLAALLSIGQNAGNEVRLMEIVTTVENPTSGQMTIKNYAPAFTAADNKADVEPHVVRYING